VQEGQVEEEAIHCSKIFLSVAGEQVEHMTLLTRLLLISIRRGQSEPADLVKLSPPLYSPTVAPPCIIRQGWEGPPLSTRKLSFP
jgi:hypothetical protein